MNHMGNSGRPRYFCNGTGEARCSNKYGTPVDALDESVRLELFKLLADNGQAVVELVEERDRRLRAEEATDQGDRRKAALREAGELEKEIADLVTPLAGVQGSADVVAAINERRAKVEVLKATPAEAPPFDKAAFFRRFAGSRVIPMLLEPSTRAPSARCCASWASAGSRSIAGRTAGRGSRASTLLV